MSSEPTSVFTKDNLDTYLKELAKEYRKLNGKSMPAEIILVGGAAILANYGFRDTTTDVDAIIRASSLMKDAINHISDRFGLPNGWLNSGNLEQIYSAVRAEEKLSKEVLIQFEQNYPKVTTTENVDSILSTLKDKASLLRQLKSSSTKENDNL